LNAYYILDIVVEVKKIRQKSLSSQRLHFIEGWEQNESIKQEVVKNALKNKAGKSSGE
jgi:vacuolar-type H+-ATPase subunit I/STV1